MGLFQALGSLIPGAGLLGLAGGTAADTGQLPFSGGTPPKPVSFDPNNLSTSPYKSPLQDAIKGIGNFNPNVNYSSAQYSGGGPDFVPGTYQDTPYEAKKYTNENMPDYMKSGYNAIQNRIRSNYAQAQDQAQETLNRQFAAMGGGPGNGALTKQTENLATQMAAKKDQDLQAADEQNAQQLAQLNQQEENKAFQSGEAAKGRQFGAFQLGQQQKFAQSQQREQTMFQDFSRRAQESFQNAQNNANRQLQLQGFQVDAASKLASLDQDWAQKQIDAQIAQYNSQLSAFTAAHTGGLLGGGGFLGTGIQI